ncbi:hypothetical protein TorRG33x02_210630 [Trema orientale]|uniref:Uncharacterized protein n=1 Tax=Trema orientale TaxID=63057 RepID=A0A2P5EC14_TREOI|nr:hypothetical protein TorRG33x02_210630 [Trema orientale]
MLIPSVSSFPTHSRRLSLSFWPSAPALSLSPPVTRQCRLSLKLDAADSAQLLRTPTALLGAQLRLPGFALSVRSKFLSCKDSSKNPSHSNIMLILLSSMKSKEDLLH